MTAGAQDVRATDRVTVIVVGAGLSGLVAARELVRAGIDDLVVLEARDRTGGRQAVFTRPNGATLELGGELTGATQVQMQALAAEYGVATAPLAPLAEPGGRFIRVVDGTPLVEAYPLETDEVAAGEVAGLQEQLAALAAEIPADAPWNAPRAREHDHQSIGGWLDEHPCSPAARAMMEAELYTFGDLYEVSLLHLLWHLSGIGSWEGNGSLFERFVGGTTQITDRLAADLAPRIRTGCPVRRVEHGADGVTVHHDGGSIAARVAIFAMEPGQIGKIAFEPVLPPDRDRLQRRWLAGRATKFVAIYETPFWREDGLAGFVVGEQPFLMIADWSTPDSDEGVLTAAYGAGSESASRYGSLLADPDTAWQLLLERLVSYFGPRAGDPLERYRFDWTGDPWSDGAGAQLPPGVLSTVGRTIRAPIGRLVWAGAETGVQDWMEGAVTSGQRAAAEARGML